MASKSSRGGRFPHSAPKHQSTKVLTRQNQQSQERLATPSQKGGGGSLSKLEMIPRTDVSHVQHQPSQERLAAPGARRAPDSPVAQGPSRKNSFCGKAFLRFPFPAPMVGGGRGGKRGREGRRALPTLGPHTVQGLLESKDTHRPKSLW